VSEPTDLTVRFHASLYPLSAVQAAAERFARFGPAVTQNGADVLVSFATVPDALRDRLPDEFKNHALFQVIVDARC
jgi:hypothetical protein